MADKSLIRRLGLALNYPADFSEVGGEFVFIVDGLKIIASESSKGVVLKFWLEASPEHIVSFAEFAFGCILRDEATLSWDNSGSSLFLWVCLSSPDETSLRHGFESFADSCEWWRSRAMEREVPVSVVPDIMIRP